jgi:hypothetical protein
VVVHREDLVVMLPLRAGQRHAEVVAVKELLIDQRGYGWARRARACERLASRAALGRTRGRRVELRAAILGAVVRTRTPAPAPLMRRWRAELTIEIGISRRVTRPVCEHVDGCDGHLEPPPASERVEAAPARPFVRG